MPSEPVVLLHGQPGAGADWDAVTDSLGGRLALVARDRPGWDGRRPAGGVAFNARTCVALLDELKIERATLVGHSFGGTIACWLAAEAPERVGALVLAAPAANAASIVRLDRWLALPLLGSLATGGMLGAAGLLLSTARGRVRMAAALGLPETHLRASARNLRSPRAWRSFGVEQRALLREIPALEARLGSIHAPTTIVIGAEDHVVPFESATTLARQIPAARLERVNGVGHLLPLLRPERLAELIVQASGP